MKSILYQIAHIERLISETKSEILTVDKLPFFKIFSRNESKEIEISCLQKSLNDYYGIKHSLLENLEIEIRKEKINLAIQMRENTLKKVG